MNQPKTSVSVEQKLWASGKLSASIKLAESNRDAAQAKLKEAQLRLALSAVEALQSFRLALERLRVNEQTTQRLGEFQALMTRRVEAEVSAPIDGVLVRSRMVQSEVDQSNAQASKRLAISRLEQLNVEGPAVAWDKLDAASLGAAADLALPADPAKAWEALELSVEQHPTTQRFEYEKQIARARQTIASAERFPLVYFRMDRNTYDDANPNFQAQNGKTTAFVGLRYVPGAGFASASQANAAAQRAAVVERQAEASRREIIDQLRQDLEEWRSASERFAGYVTAVKNSAIVSESYERQFTVGRMSWQQTLDAVREQGQVSIALADAEAAVWGASYRISLRSGDYDLSYGVRP